MADGYETWNICDVCHGTGKSGRIIEEEGQPPVEEDCSNCNGLGEIYGGVSIIGDKVYFTYRIVEATDTSEYAGLSDANKEAYGMIISSGFVDLSDGTSVRTKLWNMFDENSDTRANLIELLGE